MKLAELPELNPQVKDLTSIFLRGSDQSDEPPLGLGAHLLPKLDQHQGFDVLRYAAGAPDFGPALRERSSAHLLLPRWVPFTATSSIPIWLTHGWTGSCKADPLRHDFWGTFYTLHTRFSPSFMGPFQAEMCSGWTGIWNWRFQLLRRVVTSASKKKKRQAR